MNEPHETLSKDNSALRALRDVLTELEVLAIEHEKNEAGCDDNQFFRGKKEAYWYASKKLKDTLKFYGYYE